MKTIQFKTSSIKAAGEYLSELFAAEYNEGDRAEGTLPDGSKLIYVLKSYVSYWQNEEDPDDIIKPDVIVYKVQTESSENIQEFMDA